MPQGVCHGDQNAVPNKSSAFIEGSSRAIYGRKQIVLEYNLPHAARRRPTRTAINY